MEGALRRSLNTKQLEPYGEAGGGCINQGQGYKTDHGAVFVKRNKDAKSSVMFNGEFESLKAIYSTATIRVPKPIAVKLHLHNAQLLKKRDERAGWVTAPPDGFEQLSAVQQFGFDCATCCGSIPQDNTWKDNWPEFYAQCRLKPQVDMIMSEYGDRQVAELWSRLAVRMPALFADCPHVTPALLHGDLWAGNVSACEHEPVLFDAASYYGHSECDLGISWIFGGVNGTALDAYHQLVPKADGFDGRKPLYQLFHYMNHWNHFGNSYRSSTIATLQELLR